jgi:uncharacterized protein YqjF (DUF2071 family)
MLFYSWPIDEAFVSSRLPHRLEPDLFEGRTYVTMIPFQMRDMHLRWLPPVPGTASFDEVDVLTYVRYRKIPGIWFFRIEVDSAFMAWSGRTFMGLPYEEASVRVDGDPAGGMRSTVVRGGETVLDLTYRGVGPEYEAPAGSLARFIVERFVMFSVSGGGRLLSGREARPARRIRDAEVRVRTNDVPRMLGLPEPTGKTTAWTCARSSIRTWVPAPV